MYFDINLCVVGRPWIWVKLLDWWISNSSWIFWHWFRYGSFMVAQILWVNNYDSHHSKNESRMYQNQSLYSSFTSSSTPLNMLTLQLSILNRPSNNASNELISSNSLILYKSKNLNTCCQIRQFYWLQCWWRMLETVCIGDNFEMRIQREV